MRFHRFLSGAKRLVPEEWWVSRICQEFGCTPSAALREWRRNPELVTRVLEYRAYAAAQQQVHDAKNDTDLPAEGLDPMVDLVFEVEAQMLRERSSRD